MASRSKKARTPRRARRPLAWAAGAAALVVAAGIALSAVVLSLERAQHTSRFEAAHLADLRLALWRMDSWMAPRLATEGARPYDDYQPFHEHRRAYDRMLNRIEPGDVLTPSPLLAERSEHLLLHFQISPAGEITSPQAPRDNWRDLAVDTYLPEDTIIHNEFLLNRLKYWLQPAELDARLAMLPFPVVSAPTSSALVPPDLTAATRAAAPATTTAATRADGEAQKRAQISYESKARGTQAAAAVPGQQEVWVQQSTGVTYQSLDTVPIDGIELVEVGVLEPVWFERSGEEPALVLARRVMRNDGDYMQGFWVDWSRLRVDLLALVEDLFPDADLAPVSADDDVPQADRLATLPVALSAPRGEAPPLPLFTPVRAGLMLGWLLALAGFASITAVFRSVVALGEKQTRFATAVTHELRTPLTTFRLYTEMLADGLITDDTRKQEYLDTLKDESARLATLVENVLSYARIEDGRGALHRAPTTTVDLVAWLIPLAERRADDAGMPLRATAEDLTDADLSTDRDAIAQVLFNLIDNACKYGDIAEGRPIELVATTSERDLLLRVRDAGPGVPPARRAAIFRPFERGEEDSPKPGMGIGLALSRALARDLGGDLILEATPAGASFLLTVPIDQPRA